MSLFINYEVTLTSISFIAFRPFQIEKPQPEIIQVVFRKKLYGLKRNKVDFFSSLLVQKEIKYKSISLITKPKVYNELPEGISVKTSRKVFKTISDKFNVKKVKTIY